MSGTQAFALEMLATLTNAGLKLDPLSEAKLAAIEGQSARLDILVPGREAPVALTLQIRKASLLFTSSNPGSEQESAVNAVVRGSFPDLLRWLQGRPSQQLNFDGDEQLLSNLAGLLTGYQPDLSLPLTRIFGEEAATGLLGFVETALAATRSALEAAGNAAGDGARQQFTDTAKLRGAIETVEDLNLKVDRLLARVALLESTASDEH